MKAAENWEILCSFHCVNMRGVLMKKWLSLTPRYSTNDYIELSLYSLTGLTIDSKLKFTMCYGTVTGGCLHGVLRHSALNYIHP